MLQIGCGVAMALVPRESHCLGVDPEGVRASYRRPQGRQGLLGICGVASFPPRLSRGAHDWHPATPFARRTRLAHTTSTPPRLSRGAHDLHPAALFARRTRLVHTTSPRHAFRVAHTTSPRHAFRVAHTTSAYAWRSIDQRTGGSSSRFRQYIPQKKRRAQKMSSAPFEAMVHLPMPLML